MKDPDDYPKPKPVRRPEPPPLAPLTKPPIRLRLVAMCDVCLKDFNWCGLAAELDSKRVCESCHFKLGEF